MSSRGPWRHRLSSSDVTQMSKLAGQISVAVSPRAGHEKDPVSLPQVRKEEQSAVVSAGWVPAKLPCGQYKSTYPPDPVTLLQRYSP